MILKLLFLYHKFAYNRTSCTFQLLHLTTSSPPLPGVMACDQVAATLSTLDCNAISTLAHPSPQDDTSFLDATPSPFPAPRDVANPSFAFSGLLPSDDV